MVRTDVPFAAGAGVRLSLAIAGRAFASASLKLGVKPAITYGVPLGAMSAMPGDDPAVKRKKRATTSTSARAAPINAWVLMRQPGARLAVTSRRSASRSAARVAETVAVFSARRRRAGVFGDASNSAMMSSSMGREEGGDGGDFCGILLALCQLVSWCHHLEMLLMFDVSLPG